MFIGNLTLSQLLLIPEALVVKTGSKAEVYLHTSSCAVGCGHSSGVSAGWACLVFPEWQESEQAVQAQSPFLWYWTPMRSGSVSSWGSRGCVILSSDSALFCWFANSNQRIKIYQSWKGFGNSPVSHRARGSKKWLQGWLKRVMVRLEEGPCPAFHPMAHRTAWCQHACVGYWGLV